MFGQKHFFSLQNVISKTFLFFNALLTVSKKKKSILRTEAKAKAEDKNNSRKLTFRRRK